MDGLPFDEDEDGDVYILADAGLNACAIVGLLEPEPDAEGIFTLR